MATQPLDLANRHVLPVDRQPESQPDSENDQQAGRHADTQRSRQPDRKAASRAGIGGGHAVSLPVAGRRVKAQQKIAALRCNCGLFLNLQPRQRTLEFGNSCVADLRAFEVEKSQTGQSLQVP